MAVGNSAIFNGTATRDTAVDWETEFVGSAAVTKTVEFAIKKGDKPPDVAQKLADAFNSTNIPSPSATANGANVRFTPAKASYDVNGMRFTISKLTKNIPGNGSSVPMGNSGVSVKNANS